MEEEEKIAKARRQLLVVGVVCVAAVVFTIWLVSLRTTFSLNQKKYPSPLSALKQTQKQLGGSWDDFKQQLDRLK
ncbi:hypothetical protein A3B21_04940 [Candidatus Uhrbacteria bacterium RIFCSPLOWO2_01_FULL_47_24]|uniref:Uncharacterized protein n=1 Tax=Candidatus Uhrbacteria bacterium RIFCSPLOWO2_01_FULL_47_24 TaxID=1802401 RepID=A0A1F7UWC7_9BACT|nr:MAG: hypothetical protein A2753_02970 [Candidatus Uhrbacteria bacterium RIFCSPHIGHO2_01_FULL_47_11]OGL69299.1 MAG: hypothetical protein A3D58_03330 [Candidatus Uhrbacteria bacterium RIFCSPHIGHO2_02_FULL_46_47]OGL76369.1 MAG: hypothetical protein A3F52_00620 [Candidatus Uhrbacteria bacterium RIFCSPHIGHO2_12_FULL_47_11]OGL82034.1 MAG: hypothetical protein A3B21_04940 [Candidatus Uhrbacteria bacterium RIFCSPLOWO2_01_FULL_47_24]OGL85428.1 MAG: hypothetical protein A3J03_05105 [Candidatus Uhrbact